MTKEEKQLLLIDLCARLPYGIMVHIHDIDVDDYDRQLIGEDLDFIELDRRNCKPYLRPMSSMTPQEWCDLCDCKIEDDKAATIVNGRRFVSHVNEESFLNSHHFDHHNLIEKGLALEAPEGMYTA